MQKVPSICVVGLGYVGMPLLAAFGKTGWQTFGFDVNPERIRTLKGGADWTGEVSEAELRKISVEYSDDASVIAKANTIIVAVPTPVNEKNIPDLRFVESASVSVGKNLQKGTVVVYESTVYPGVTEEICVPILEKESGLKCGKDFTVGYSPERINPGDKEHTIDKIVKVVAGQDEKTTDWLALVYGKIVPAGIFRAKNIKVAEMAKAIENTQRDINIALMNEVAVLCSHLGINTRDVLDAASTKWNFLRFSPGLVGGHCIGVDPYYLVHKAKQYGMTTDVISAGRKINDAVPEVIERQISSAMKNQGLNPKNTKVLVLGLTFKENIPDTRNAKVHDVIRLLEKNGCSVVCHDPYVSSDEVKKLGFTSGTVGSGPFEIVVAAVMHKEFSSLSAKEIASFMKKGGIFYDVKSHWEKNEIESLGIHYLSL